MTPRTVTVDEILHIGDPVKVLVPEGSSLSLPVEALQSGLSCRGTPARRATLAAKIVTMYEDLDIIALVIKPEEAEALKLQPDQTLLLEKATEDGLWLGATSLRSLNGCRLELFWPRNCASVERREYCRVPLASAVRYALAETPTLFECGVLQDISGGGVRLAVQEDAPVSGGQRLILEIHLGMDLMTMAGVVRHVYTGKDGQRVLGIEFQELPETDQGRVVSFVFSEQLRMRREKLLQD